MKVANVTMDRWKGQNNSRDIGRFNLLTGPNGSGKSALMEGLRWCLTGTSALGRRPESAIAYGDGTGCGVTVQTDNGLAFARSLKVDNRFGAVTQTLSISGKPGIGIREAEAAIKAACGEFMPMWDLSEFLSLSPDKRRDFVLDLCAKANPKTADPKAIMDRVWELAVEALAESLGIDLGGMTDEQTKAVNELVDEIHQLVRREIQLDMTRAVASALVKARETMNRAKAQADGAAEASRRLRDRLAQIKVAAESVAELRQKCAEHTKLAQAFAELIGQEQAKGVMIEAIQKNICRLNEQIERAQAGLGRYKNEDVSDQMAKALTLEQESADLRADAEKIEMPDVDAIRVAQDVCQQQLDVAYTTCRQMQKDVDAASLRLSEIELKLASLDGSLWTKALTLVRDVIAAFEQAVCVTTPPALEELEALCRSQSREDECDDLRRQQESARANLATLRDLLSAAEKGLEQARTTFESLRTQMAEAIAVRSQRTSEVAKLEHEAQDKLEEAEGIRESLRDRESSIARIVKDIERMTEERDRFIKQADSPQFTSRTPVEDRKASRNAAIRAAAECQQLIEAKERFAALDAELQSVVSSAERERLTYEVAKAVTKAIKVVREQLMEELVGPLTGHITRFYGHGRTAYCQLENTKGSPVLEFGLSDGMRDTPLESMSGGESVMFSAALSYAMVMMADPPLKVLLIEAAEVDHDVFSDLLNALERIGGDVDNIFVATCGYAVGSDNWNTINLWQGRPVIEMEV